MRFPRPVAALALAGALLVGCGTDRTGAELIRQDAATVVKAINAKDAARARQALQTLDSDLSAAQRLDQLTAEETTALRERLTQLLADLALITPAPRVTTPPPTTRPPTVQPKDDGKGRKRHGKDD